MKGNHGKLCGKQLRKEKTLTTILIAADMEGVTGVVHWDQVNTSHPEYARYRRLMTEDVNAAIRGTCRAGADEIIVSDGHSFGRNILIDELDSRARLNTGSPSPLSMVQGINHHIDGALFVGYHARIGTPNAILEHTWSDERVSNFAIKGASDAEYRPMGEIGINAAMCGYYGVPVIMVSGDQSACDEGRAYLGNIETAVVKQAAGRMAAECLPPAIAQERIEQAAYRAVSNLSLERGVEESYRPLVINSPITVAIDFVQSEMAEKAAMMPGAQRDGRRVEYLADNMLTAYRAFRTLVALAR